MNDATCLADWKVSYPAAKDGESDLLGLLRGRLMCNWSWDVFLWDLKELRRLLTKCPEEFNYYYVTRFLVARATYLAWRGPFECSGSDVLAGLAKRNVQFAGIYRHLFMLELERAKYLRKPDTLIPQDERFFQLTIVDMEEGFRRLLEALTCLDDPNEDIMGHPVREWLAGAVTVDGERVELVPPTVRVNVQSEDLRSYRKIKPCRNEIGRKLVRKDTIFTVRERHGLETPCDMDLERLCTWNTMKGHPVVKYGDDCFQYFAATMNESRDAIDIVCADRTLQIVNETILPGTAPREIHTWWLGENRGVYEVSFDNGKRGLCQLSVRPHKEAESKHVPVSVTRQVNRRGLDLAGCSGVRVGVPVRLADEPSAGAERTIRTTVPQRTQHSGATVPVFCRGLPVATVRNQWKEIGLPSGDVLDLGGKKRKRRELLKAVWEHCQKEGRRDFLFETVRADLAQQQHAASSVKSDRFRHDVFKGDQEAFDEMFTVLGAPTDEKYRLRVRFSIS